MSRTIGLALLAFTFVAATAHADAWPRFRGPGGDGQAEALDVPSVFTSQDYAWQSPLLGLGHSSPVVWNDRIFLTSGNPDTAELTVMCFDLATGDELWQRRLPGGAHAMHRVNSYGTATPALDDRQVYVAWRAGQAIMLAAFTHGGDPVWQKEVGRLEEMHGFGTSPMLAGETVCLTIDTDVEELSSIVGVDRRTGNELWRQPCGVGKTSYATPYLWQAPDGEQLILMATMSQGLTAYEPATGHIAWNAFTRDLPDRCVSSPVLVGDTLLISCGSGNNGKHLIGARMGAANQPPFEAYRLDKSIPNVPTPVAAGDLAFLWYDRGVVTCIDGSTGELHWRQRVGGNFHCSPVRVGDRLFCISLTGDVIVIAAKDQYELLGRSQLEEPVTATPAVVDGRMLIRTEQSLICLGGER